MLNTEKEQMSTPLCTISCAFRDSTIVQQLSKNSLCTISCAFRNSIIVQQLSKDLTLLSVKDNTRLEVFNNFQGRNSWTILNVQSFRHF